MGEEPNVFLIRTKVFAHDKTMNYVERKVLILDEERFEFRTRSTGKTVSFRKLGRAVSNSLVLQPHKDEVQNLRH